MKRNDEDYIKIIKWYVSFIPLAIAIILFGFCFIFESNIIYYIIMFMFFVAFVRLYLKANKRITLSDGYTLIQAMSFFKACNKKNLQPSDSENIKELMKLANELEYACELSEEQVITLYKIGEKLVEDKREE